MTARQGRSGQGPASATKRARAAPSRTATPKVVGRATRKSASGKTTARKKARTPYGSLNRAEIIQAALVVIDEVGVDGLTMRRLGAQLGSDPMAIYRHFANKDDLLRGVIGHQVDRLYDVDLTGHDDPVDLFVHVALHHWDVVHEHPNLAIELTARPVTPSERVAQARVGVQAARSFGVPDDDIPLFIDLTANFGVSYILHEALKPFLDIYITDDELDGAREAMRVELDADSTDTSVEWQVIERQLTPTHNREAFEVGLRVLLVHLRQGVEAALRRP